ncbi:metal-dependent hydrolase [uncultured Campylobacter sp.]|uniref:aminofutalosine deaminase family hydrolase n=1 Tax=uncultured Campylobacter sp. TaxID=218934 RepID=UPI002625445A|nr:metal-dependent hydrolase [uncultured Campylobacter sp.]
MRILRAKWVLVCDENFKILKDGAIVFDKKIIEVCTFASAARKYPQAEILDFSGDIAMPAFINPHVHLEFSANKGTLRYGDFLDWLGSVIASRQQLDAAARGRLIAEQIAAMMRSGVGTIGEISSFGGEAEACAQSGIRTVFFNEILGASKDAAAENILKFKQRFERSKALASSLFIPAVSVHSPYSAHPQITEFATKFARENGLAISTHFMESAYERQWLRTGRGKFKAWLAKFNPAPAPFYSPQSFVAHFSGLRTLFTHCVWVDDFSIFDPKLHSITHCARSNRLLSKKRLSFKKLLASGLNYNIATDGLSSNFSLSFLDELRANLMMHDELSLTDLARALLLGATRNAAAALGLNLGELKADKLADIAVFEGIECEQSQLALQLILQSKNAKSLFIEGMKCNF